MILEFTPMSNLTVFHCVVYQNKEMFILYMGATENILKIRQLSSKNIISYKKHLLNLLEFPQELMGIHRMAGL